MIATGGLTVPKIGATPFGYRIAEQFGIAIVPPRPALVPLAFDPAALARYGDLSGVSVDAEVSCNGGRFRDGLLFTHRGLSGPAILQISSYWNGGDALSVDLLPGRRRAGGGWKASAIRRRDWTTCSRAVCRGAWRSNGARRTAPRSRSARSTTGAGASSPALLHDWPVLPSGTLGYNKAEVTLGGVDTRALSSRTMAARERAAAAFHRRGRRRHRLAGRLQLSMGVVFRLRGRPARLTGAVTGKPECADRSRRCTASG